MALAQTFHDPFGGPDLADCYCRWTDLVISPGSRSIRLVFAVYRDQAARDAERLPLPISVEFRIGPEAVPAQYGPPPVLDPGDPTADPPVPPTYGPAPLLQPSIPSYDEFSAGMDLPSADGAPAVSDVLGSLAYGYAKSRPEFTGATDLL